MNQPVPSPPTWVQALLETILPPRDLLTVSGDLIEEYREVIAPERGIWRANVWYLRQILSLLTADGLFRLMRSRPAQKCVALLWMAAAVAQFSVIVVLLVRSGLEPPRVSFATVMLVFAATALCLASSLRAAADAVVWRFSFFWGGLFAAVLIARMAFDIVLPFDPAAWLQAQARGGFAALNFPRLFLVGVAIAFILMAAGFRGAQRTGRVRHGIFAAVISGGVGFALTVAAAALRAAVYSGHRPAEIDPPPVGILAVVAISTVLGGIGAMFGRGLDTLFQRPNRKGESRMRRLLSVFAPVLTIVFFIGCSRVHTLADLVQVHELSPDKAPVLAAMPFDSSTPLTVSGTVSTLLFAEKGVPGFVVVHDSATGKKYVFSTAATRDMNNQGLRRRTLNPGQAVTVTGVLAQGSQKIDDFTAARADVITVVNGSTVFDRALLAQ